jgi:hypothetical protein
VKSGRTEACLEVAGLIIKADFNLRSPSHFLGFENPPNELLEDPVTHDLPNTVVNNSHTYTRVASRINQTSEIDQQKETRYRNTIQQAKLTIL